jgi:hypothetical protein
LGAASSPCGGLEWTKYTQALLNRQTRREKADLADLGISYKPSKRRGWLAPTESSEKREKRNLASVV